MKPLLEHLPWEPDSSLAMLNRRLLDGIPFQWHHHPEFELTLTLNSRGQRFIGDHVEKYGDGDLVLVGPNLPHTWASQAAINPAEPHVALVIWFSLEWAEKISGDLIEFAALKSLLSGAGRGLAFSADVAAQVREDFQRFFDQEPFERLLTLLKILGQLSKDPSPQTLASVAAQQVKLPERHARIDRVLSHIHAHYTAGVSMTELADVAALSVSGLHRMFRSQMQSTISDYLIALRVGDACARLSSNLQPISHIADTVGYRNIANFNRQFKAAKGITPRQYRASFS
ncbi:MAG: helix-turn-helix domain-containing protein [Rhodobacteraceae bacterium]|nr:helix-turn-helix domain-containing protein [Paracoccaceae bacterium]